jgi:hypothetical protein
MCRLLEISKSGFYAQEERALSNHARQDVELRALIHEIYERSHRTYGNHRVHFELGDTYGVHVGRKRVARLDAPSGAEGGAQAQIPLHDAAGYRRALGA